ncbi:major facilitator superfamily domain-containing protein [Dissophora ornata]|nr:hypothetical protein BGZ58_006465 [Dissophora ornata]KAI8600548.1 major facilitator superfamily domain-containing protein [Dissophora ornata]
MAAPPNRAGAIAGAEHQQQHRPNIPRDLSGDTIDETDEDTPLLSLTDDGEPAEEAKADPTTLYVRILEENLPCYKRPSALWLLPVFGLATISGGMLASTIGQFQATLLCREYMSRHAVSNTTIAAVTELTTRVFHEATESAAGAMLLRPALECQSPEIQAFTAQTMAMIEVLGGIAGALTIGYYASLSDKHGRRSIMAIGLTNTLFMLCAIVVMGTWWDQVGIPFLVAATLVNGLLGGIGMGGTMSLAYAADCTDPSRRSLVYSWIHAGLFMGLGIGSFLGGLIVRATDNFLTIIYFDIVATIASLLVLIFFMPESLPSKQAAHIRKLYGQATKSTQGQQEDDLNKTKTKEQPIAWHSHMLRSLRFFRPNGRNTNLILLAATSFLQTLVLKGTFSVLILYTNKAFNWSEYEDGILFMLGSVVRLFSLLILLPILVHFYRKHMGPKEGKNSNNNSSTATRTRPHNGAEQDNETVLTNHPERLLNSGTDDLVVASRLEHLGEAVLNLSDDEGSLQERRRRQSTTDSVATWSSDRTRRPSSSHSPSSPSNSKKPFSRSSPSPSPPSTAPTRTTEKKLSDVRLDTWIIRLGFIINSTTYIGYGLANKEWQFYLWSSLHAVSIIASPSLRSLLTNLVDPSQFGAVLGAIQVVDSIASFVSPVVISGVYAMTVRSRPEFVWYCCAAFSGICVVLSFMMSQKQFLKATSVV